MKEKFRCNLPHGFLLFVRECSQTYGLDVWSYILLLVTFWGERKNIFVPLLNYFCKDLLGLCLWIVKFCAVCETCLFFGVLLLHGLCLVVSRGEMFLCCHVCCGFYGIPLRRSGVWFSCQTLALSLYQPASSVVHMMTAGTTPTVVRKMASKSIHLDGIVQFFPKQS